VSTQQDARRIALSLPETVEAEDSFAFSVRNGSKYKRFAWAWNEGKQPKAPRAPNPDVLAVRVANLAEKEALLAAEPVKCFTEPHYNGFPSVLLRLAHVDADELGELITDAWVCQAPAELVRLFQTGPAPR
jgi:hypothetical protein